MNKITKFINKYWIRFINESDTVPSETHKSRIIEPNQSISQLLLLQPKYITYYININQQHLVFAFN